MELRRLFLVLITVFLIILTGCSKGSENEEQFIKVQKHIGNENNFKDLKEITKNNQVHKVHEILDNVDWENGKFDRGNLADFRFVFQPKNPKIKVEALVYELWISPNKDNVELVIDATSKFVQLDKNKSAELYEILTGGKLSDLK